MSAYRIHQKTLAGTRLFVLAVLSIVGAWAGLVLASAAQTDISKEGVYQSGLWRYEGVVSNRGTKSEGYHGRLWYNGEVLPEPANGNDYYQTPWGPVRWVGQPVVLWGSHGWVPCSQDGPPAGQALPVPLIEGRLIVCAEVLTPGALATPDRLEKRAWVLANLKEFGVKEGHVQCDWLRLGKESITIHDTKRWGTAQMRWAESAADKPLAVEIIGRGQLFLTPPPQGAAPAESAPPGIRPKATQTVELPRQPGATRLVKYTLVGLPFDDPLDLYLAFRVESPGRVLVVGPEAKGKTVTVTGADTVMIRLPSEEPSRAGWVVTSVKGKAVEALGGVEFEEDTSNPLKVALGGTCKVLFRVQQKGRATVALAYRSWGEEGKPAGKSFEVRLNVQSVAAQQAAEPGVQETRR